jgi:hypothetical protein
MSIKISGTTVIDNNRKANIDMLRLSGKTLSTLGGTVGQLVYVTDANGGQGTVMIRNATEWVPAFGYSGTPIGDGGIEYVSNGFKYHAFGVGTNTFKWTGGNIEILLIGGGGGGGAGRTSGGGGAGGLSVISAYLPGSTHTVSVGAGSAGAAPYPGPYGNAVANSNGGNTWIFQESGNTYVRGGGGGWPAKTGGSGAGGNSQASAGGGGSSGPGYVNPGGTGTGPPFPSNPNVAAYLTGAGGGGSAAKGTDSPRANTVAGRGGNGHSWPSLASLNPAGSPVAWVYSPSTAPVAPPSSSALGVCGGGTGGFMPGYGSPGGSTPVGGGGAVNQAGRSNGAGGGGGSWAHSANYAGQKGGNGLCIVRYPI